MRLTAPRVALFVACCALQAAPAQAALAVHAITAGKAHDALFAVALSDDSGLAVGAAGQLLESADAGQSWTQDASVDTPMALLGVDISGGNAIAVGQQGVVLVRHGQAAWTAGDSGSKERLFAVALDAQGTAYAVGAFGTVLRSADAGATWSSIAPSWSDYSDMGDPHLYAIDLASDGAVMIAGEFGLILRSVDAGMTWSRQHAGDASLFALDLADDGTGYAVGQNGVALKTVDGGASWTDLDVGSGANLLGVVAAQDVVYLTGMHELRASSDGGASWQSISADGDAIAWLAGLAVSASGRDAIAVGHAGRVVRLGD